MTAEPVNMNAYHFHDPVMLYGNGNDKGILQIELWSLVYSHHSIGLGLKFSSHFLDLITLFLALIPASTLGILSHTVRIQLC